MHECICECGQACDGDAKDGWHETHATCLTIGCDLCGKSCDECGCEDPK
jgi:hypothetical protein